MRGDSGSFDSLIDAEREALAREGRPVGKIALIRALREATGLGLREAKEAVEGYLGRRAGSTPTATPGGRPSDWFDDLLDAERKAAAREDRPITRIGLIKALRGASGLGPGPARRAVEDYLGRRGGAGLPDGAMGWRAALNVLGVLAILVGLAAAGYFAFR